MVTEMRLHLLAALIIASTLAGCLERPTPYQDMGFLGGVSVTQVDAITIQVVAKGNGFTPPGTLVEFVHLKAADETIAHGYDVFQIIDSNDAKRIENIQFTPYSSTPVSKFTETALVKMSKGPMPKDASGDYFDAHYVEQTLGAIYKPRQTGARN